MIDGKRVLCVVPARSGSKGLKDKNIRELAGKPLLAWPVCCARGSKYIDRIIVSTDSEKYAGIARQYQADVPFLRPENLAQDTTTTIDVIEDLLKQLQESYDILVLLEPTSPLTETKDIDVALESLIGSWEKADAIVGITQEIKSHPAYLLTLDEEKLIHSLNADFSKAVRRQELPEVYRMDGTLYISKVDALLNKHGFYHDRTIGFIVPEWKSYEIDSMTDFICIEAIMQNREVLS
ncbi:acylneuraminate cytidylyltransferase family protein [Thalassolituus alkanivorans]|uniref:acylneuraminate cytidylyltransferase family protein n=1 Tax=Thalassolituus alkanivorans TaxID=2881055 RepID=UPI001E28EB29|nr:acylneuraminate cytidylyltransferase family protein [Thalassolituus alkanivorans]MCB2385261.1 acylneuraminate cytidylyltransferase family protein [Thalassolituus alkanivorans]MCB2421882.1 acylneuraminate cytidylyltransferase family protein [Thalassolituus alkanivorans]